MIYQAYMIIYNTLTMLRSFISMPSIYYIYNIYITSEVV